MEDTKKNLFYSEEEKLLFYVAGYTDNSDVVDDIISTLNLGVDKLATISGALAKEVRTALIPNSSRYRSMRVFYVKTDTIPKDAFKIQGEWNMWKWLEN